MEQTTEMKVKKDGVRGLRFPFYVLLLTSLILTAAFFMPLATATGEYREYLEKYPDAWNVEEIKMTNRDAVNVSMYDFARMYGVVYRLVDKTLATIVTVTISAAGILSIVVLLLTLAKKPIGILIFNALTLGSYYLTVLDFKMRGVMPNKNYNWGISYYLYFCCTGVICVAAVWMLIKKIQIKHKKKNKGDNENEEI